MTSLTPVGLGLFQYDGVNYGIYSSAGVRKLVPQPDFAFSTNDYLNLVVLEVLPAEWDAMELFIF